jgi:hypothetical protein
MSPDCDQRFEQRVTRAAQAALDDHQYVSIVDLLTGMNLLAPSNVAAWKQGRIDFLEQGRPRTAKNRPSRKPKPSARRTPKTEPAPARPAKSAVDRKTANSWPA